MSSLRHAAQQLIDALRQTSIPYAIGGSFASSIHGIARATQDLDLIIDLALNRVLDLHAAIAPHFYADGQAMRDAILQGSSFNAIHLATGFKFDLFIARRHPLGLEQLAHRRPTVTSLLGGDPLEVNVISAEDIILAKLHWYRAGGEVSERQWNDLVNLFTVQADRLDLVYLRAEAQRLAVADLLKRFGTRE
jgi:hypothetical protein